MQRISVIGISGSGKSTLAREIAAHIGAPLLELDSLFHQPNWTPLPTAEFRARVADFVRADRWVVDGNYSSRVQDLVWEAADTIVWPDLPKAVILPRLGRRTLRRMRTREELWNGNRERWRNLFDPRPTHNILIWLLTHHGPARRRNEKGLLGDNARHLSVHRLRTPTEVHGFRAAHLGLRESGDF